MKQTIGQAFLSCCDRVPKRNFIFSYQEEKESVQKTTYCESMVKVAETIQHFSRLGIQQNDRIVCFLEDPDNLIHFSLACAIQGIIWVPISPSFSMSYLKGIVKQVGANWVFTTPGQALELQKEGIRVLSYQEENPHHGIEWIPTPSSLDFRSARKLLYESMEDVMPEDVFMYQPTSGSSGAPKLVIRKHSSFFRYAKFVGMEMDNSEETPHRFLMIAALTHAFGLHMFATALTIGAELAIPSCLDTKACLLQIRKLKPTVLPLVPRMAKSLYEQYLGVQEEKESFIPQAKYLLSAGGRSDPGIMTFARDQGIQVLEFYGSSEASIVALTPFNGWKKNHVGVPVSDVHLKITDDKEILVKSPGLMLGYFGEAEKNNPAITEDGFYRTGDLGELTTDGYLRILGRKKDVFNTPEGSNIYPERIEMMIEALTWVQQAMLVGDQKPYLTAFIVLKKGVHSPDLRKKIEKSLIEINRKLEKVEQVGNFQMLYQPFPEIVYKTVGASKICRKRKEFTQLFVKEISHLYSFRQESLFVSAI